MNIFRIVIKNGIIIYGFHTVKKNDGDVGPPPMTTNFLAAINALTSGISDVNNSVAIGAILHASSALLNRETLENKEYEGFIRKFSKLFEDLVKQRAKNSPLYSKLVQTLWISNPTLVLKCYILHYDILINNIALSNNCRKVFTYCSSKYFKINPRNAHSVSRV